MLAATVTSLLVLGISTSAAAGADPAPGGDELAFEDVRASALARPGDPSAAQEALRRSLGPHGIVEVDPLTGTPRVVARLDGFLTEPAAGEPADLVLAYVRAHPAVFGLDEDDLAGLRLVRDETDSSGIRHLLWAQEAGGIAAFDNDLRASVTSDGRILNVMGSPLPDLQLPAAGLSVDAGGAVVTALRDAGAPVATEPRTLTASRGAALSSRFAGGHRAGLVLVNDGRRVRLAWRVTAHADAAEVYDTLVDAESGDVLRRANKVADADAMGSAWEYYPGAPVGGEQVLSNWTAKGWLPADSTILSGPYARVFADVNDSDTVNANEEATEADHIWDSPPVESEHESGFCAPTPPYVSVCTWDSALDDTRLTNRLQNSAQVFHFVNTFHDHLTTDLDILWNERTFENGDKVKAHALDGALTGPDAFHVSNANMLTLPDGQSPRMQMYLFTSFTGDFASDPTPDVNGGDDASVVYHEYAHGLSNRLITYADGWGALDAFQSSAMGEGWSDWYAMDYLVEKGYAPDTPAAGEVTLDRYIGNALHTLRTEGLDCPVAPATPPECPGGADTGAEGGYTLGDVGRIFAGGPQVHADGELWAQTLWDLREAVGVADARFLVTQGMRESPPNPSFLDMRNAILQANTIGVWNGRTDREAEIWSVFAGRGMGYFASVDGADDTAPDESFALPPDPGDGLGSIAGTVTNLDTGAPLAGVRVEFANLNLLDMTDALGRYEIANVPAGTYPKVVASKGAYSRVLADNVQITADAQLPADFELRRDWAASVGGGRIHAFTGLDFTDFGCGPEHAIDQSFTTGWSTETDGDFSIIVKLPRYVDVRGFGVDPGAICGDPETASLRGYRIQTSKTAAGGSWTTVKAGSFGLGSAHRLNTVGISKRRAVRYVRFTITSNHGHPAFMDLAELEVFGTLTPMCLGRPATKVGTAGANRLRGSAGADVIVGLGGGDRINGRGGNDRICGGEGADRLNGAGGRDRIAGGTGNDRIYARDGRKDFKLHGGTGTDRVRKDRADRTTSIEFRL